MPTLANNVANPRVLVVEDEPLIAAEVQERLTRLGFEVAAIVDTGEEAIQAAHRELPDLVLMDIQLKGKMDGIEAASKIRRDLNTAVVYLTAHSDKATHARAMETAPCGYVLKPFREEDLLVAIETAIYLTRQERRLKASEARYEATLSSIIDGVIATDEEGRITFMNRVATALTGWELSGAFGLPVERVLKLVDEFNKNLLESPVRRVLRERTVVLLSDAKLLIGKDGEAIPVDSNAAPITTDRGVLIGSVVAFRDLRGRRITETALRKAEEQLRLSQKMDAIGRLAGGVAHDFNNLLTIINGCADLALGNAQINSAVRDLLRDILDAGERAAALTNQLLTFSRKRVLDPVVLDLNTLVAGMENMLRRLVREDVTLSFHLSPFLGRVTADPSQFEQVIMNLVVNAREAMSDGGNLSIETANVTVEGVDILKYPGLKVGHYVMLAVTDTGAGMTDAIKAHVFEPFFTTKKLKRGTGLGLATVHGIVAQSGGDIRVDTLVGRGTTFSIYLPLIAESPPMLKQPKVVEPLQMGDETILLVEDEDGVRSVLTSVLKRLGYTVISAQSGREALAVCAGLHEPIHMLLTDVVMPEMGGLELGERVRELRPGLPILYLSGYIDDDLVRRSSPRKGHTAFLQKPAGPKELACKVRQSLDSPAFTHVSLAESYDESR